MAMSIVGTTEAPQHITLSRYTVDRLETPLVTLCYTETVDATEPPVPVASADGVRIVVPAWKGRTDLVGKDVLIGHLTVATVQSIEAEVADENGNITTPETIVLAGAPTESLADKSVTLKIFNASGAVAHRPSVQGRSWQIYVSMAGEGVSLLNQLLGGASVELTMKVLAAMGITTYTEAEVYQGVMTLAASGENLDSILASRGESVELDRQAGSIPFARVMGPAPTP